MKNEKKRKNIWTNNHPLLRKLNIMLTNAQQENKYDYERVMKEIDFRVNRNERQRELLSASREREKKMQIRLQEMSEQRQTSLDNKRKKIFEKEKKYKAYITEVNKEREKRKLYLSSSNAIDRLRKVREQEQQFCDDTQKKINENLRSYTHLRIDVNNNYLKHIHELNTSNTDKVQAKKTELEKSRRENLEKKISDKEINLAKFVLELKKERKEKLKDYKDNLFNKNKSVIERRGELLRSREDSLNKLMEKEKNKKISVNASERIKQFTEQLDNYNNLQKRNYDDVLKGIEQRNDFLNKRHHDFLIFDEENTKKNEKIAKKSQKEKLDFNQLLDKKYESFLTDLRDINLQNIFNKKRNERMKEYFQLKKEEKERLEKEKEEKEKAEGKY